MKHHFFLFFILLVLCLSSGQSQIVKVPRQISLDIRYRNTFSARNIENNASNGIGLEFDYAWQLSGLDQSRPAVYISVPLGYEMMFAGGGGDDKPETFLMYGWTVRHELAVNRKFIPYLAYGLLLNRLYISDVDGSVSGHQTRFQFGVNRNTLHRLKWFVCMGYSYSSYPSLGNKEKIVLHAASLGLGIRL